jgi:hypothetical protein
LSKESVMAGSELGPDDEDDADSLPFPEQDFAVEDIELAYRQALEALDAAERQVGSVMVDMVEPAASIRGEDESVAEGFSIGAQLAEDLRSTAEAAEASGNAVLVEGLRRVSPREVIEATWP